MHTCLYPTRQAILIVMMHLEDEGVLDHIGCFWQQHRTEQSAIKYAYMLALAHMCLHMHQYPCKARMRIMLSQLAIASKVDSTV